MTLQKNIFIQMIHFCLLMLVTSRQPCTGDDCFDVLQKMPDPELVFNKLFERKGPMIDKGEHDLSYALVTFVNFVLENIISTNPSDFSKSVVSRVSTNTMIPKTILPVNFSPNSTLALRTYAEVGINPPIINMSYAGAVQLSTDDVVFPLARQSAHWGHRVWLNLFHGAYRRILSVSSARFPKANAAKLSNITFGTITLLINQILINEYIPSINPTANLNLLRTFFDVRACPNLTSPYPMDLEFMQLYQWHHLIPDVIQYRQPIPVSYTLRNASGYTAYSTKDHIEAFARTRTGSNETANNEPTFMRHVTPETIRRARALNFGSLNDIRQKYKLPRYTSFNEFNPETAAILMSLYRSVDDIDAQAALVVSQSTIREVITYGAYTRLRYRLTDDCSDIQNLVATMKDVLFDPRGPVAVLTDIETVDGRHPFQAPPKFYTGKPTVRPTPRPLSSTHIEFGIGTDIQAPRNGRLPTRPWKKTGLTEFKLGNVVLNYKKTTLSKIRLTTENHTITFDTNGTTTINGDVFNNTAIPYNWMPGGCNAAMGGLYYFRADRMYFPIYDVFTKDGGGPVLTGVFFPRKTRINETETLDFGGRVLTGARSISEANICIDRPDIPENIFIQTQHIRLLTRMNIKAKALMNVFRVEYSRHVTLHLLKHNSLYSLAG